MFFSTVELQITDVNSEGVQGKWKYDAAVSSPLCVVTNSGIEDAYIVFSEKPEKFGDLVGSKATLIPVGETRYLSKFNYAYWYAATRTGPTELHLHAARIP